MALEATTRRILTVVLAGVALLALIVAALVIVFAVRDAGAWLIASTVVVVLALGGEVALLFLGRAPDDEAYDFVIDADAPTQQR